MKTKVSIAIVFSALLFSHFAQASAGWTDFVTVEELVPTARHYYEVRLPVKENPSGVRTKRGSIKITIHAGRIKCMILCLRE